MWAPMISVGVGGAHGYGGQPAHRAVSTVDHRTPDRETVGTAARRVDRRALSDVARSRSTRPQGNSRVPKRYEEGRSARFVARRIGDAQQLRCCGAPPVLEDALRSHKGSRGDLAVTIRELLWATLRISFIDGITQCCSLRPGKCYSPWPFSAW